MKFRVFGSCAWTRIPSKKRRALEPQSEECVIVGYQEWVKGYSLQNPKTKIFFNERSVKFEEVFVHVSTPLSNPPLVKFMMMFSTIYLISLK